jgi:hypothetical protein
MGKNKMLIHSSFLSLLHQKQFTTNKIRDQILYKVITDVLKHF